MFIPNPAGKAAAMRALSAAVEGMAQGLVVDLQANLNQPGSGRQMPGQPNRSSAPGEYAARQSGALQGSVDARPVGWGVLRIGLWDAPWYTRKLEYDPPSRGGRPIMRRFMAEVIAR